jgi:hypothetical protein
MPGLGIPPGRPAMGGLARPGPVGGVGKFELGGGGKPGRGGVGAGDLGVPGVGGAPPGAPGVPAGGLAGKPPGGGIGKPPGGGEPLGGVGVPGVFVGGLAGMIWREFSGIGCVWPLSRKKSTPKSENIAASEKRTKCERVMGFSGLSNENSTKMRIPDRRK